MSRSVYTCRYTEICGFQGVFAGLLVGLKQIMPENDVTLVGYVKFRAKVNIASDTSQNSSCLLLPCNQTSVSELRLLVLSAAPASHLYSPHRHRRLGPWHCLEDCAICIIWDLRILVLLALLSVKTRDFPSVSSHLRLPCLNTHS